MQMSSSETIKHRIKYKTAMINAYIMGMRKTFYDHTVATCEISFKHENLSKPHIEENQGDKVYIEDNNEIPNLI